MQQRMGEEGSASSIKNEFQTRQVCVSYNWSETCEGEDGCRWSKWEREDMSYQVKATPEQTLCLRCTSEIMPAGVEMATHLEVVGQKEKQRRTYPLKVTCQESLAKDSPRTRPMGIWMVAGSGQYSISFPKRVFTYLIYKNYFEISQSCWYCTGNNICFVQRRVAGYPQSTQLLSNLLMIGSEPLITTHEHFTFPLGKHRYMKALCIIGEKLLKSLTQSHWIPFSKAFVNIWPKSQYSF